MLYQFTIDGWAEFSVKITKCYPCNFIQLLDFSEANITSNMAQQVILGEAVSRTKYYLLSHITCDITPIETNIITVLLLIHDYNIAKIVDFNL